MKAIYSTIMALLFFSSLSYGQSGDWNLRKNEKGIKVYTKNIGNSGFKQFKAEMTISCLVQDAVSVIKDTDNAHNWLHNCKSSELLKKQSELVQYNYNVTDMPFPFEDRDIVFKMESIPGKTSYTINATGLPDYIPQKKGLTRMTKAEGKWELIQNNDSTLSITYSMHIEPGGSLPPWLVNTKVTEIPFETLYKLRKTILEK